MCQPASQPAARPGSSPRVASATAAASATATARLPLPGRRSQCASAATSACLPALSSLLLLSMQQSANAMQCNAMQERPKTYAMRTPRLGGPSFGKMVCTSSAPHTRVCIRHSSFGIRYLKAHLLPNENSGSGQGPASTGGVLYLATTASTCAFEDLNVVRGGTRAGIELRCSGWMSACRQSRWGA